MLGHKNVSNRKTLDRRILIEKHGLKCYWCGIGTDDSIYNDGSPRATTIDHLFNNLDRARQGNDDKTVVACYACNQMRARMHEFVFRGNIPITSRPLVEVPDERGDQVEVEKIEPKVPVEVETPKESIKTIQWQGDGPTIVVDVPQPLPIEKAPETEVIFQPWWKWIWTCFKALLKRK
jgi:hypothetical protein